MELVKNILIGIYVIVCVILIVLVMKQSKEGWCQNEDN